MDDTLVPRSADRSGNPQSRDNASTPAPPLWRTFATFLAPMVLANVLQALSATLNTVFVGQMLGTHALAAVSSVFPAVFFLISLVIGIGSGASVLIAQAWGAGESHKVKAIAGTALMLCLALACSVAVLGWGFSDALVGLLHAPADVHAEAVAYARLMMLAMPAMLCCILVTQMLRGVGDTVTPLIALVVSSLVSCALTPAFIRGWAGLPRLGASAAAAASIVSYVVALGCLAALLRRGSHPMAPDREFLRVLSFDLRILRLVLRIGLPAGIQSIVISAAQIVLMAFANRFGAEASAAAGAVNQIANYVQFPALSIAITASILGAQAIGAGRHDHLRDIVRTGLWMNVVVTGALVLLAMLFAKPLLGAFSANAAVVEKAADLLRLLSASIVVYGAALVLAGVMRASGFVVVPTLIAVGVVLAVEVPAAYVLSGRFGLRGVWMAYPVAFCTMLALQAICYTRVWLTKRVDRLV